jgi:putative ABC transport system substrate-binding protein
MKRREFIAGLAGAAVAFPHAAPAQQPALPIVGFLNGGSADLSADRLRGFHRGNAGYSSRGWARRRGRW